MSKVVSGEYKKYTHLQQQRLLIALAEQLKTPLLQISRIAELESSSVSAETLHKIKALSDFGQELIEHYLLSLSVEGLQNIKPGPVSVGAIFSSAAHRLQKLATLYDCDLEIVIQGNHPPVLADPVQLEAALSSLGAVFIESSATSSDSRRPVVVLAAHKTRWGVVAGAYSKTANFNSDVLRRARMLYGYSRQPFAQVQAPGGAGILIADALLSNMSNGLRPARYHRLNGLATTLPASDQMRLI